MEDRESFFGGVVLMSKEHLEKTNEYSNGYWGWGYEDTDLLLRCRVAGLGIGQRDGTFVGLAHEHRGSNNEGQRSPEAIRNAERFKQQAAVISQAMRVDGLSSVEFEKRGEALLRVGGVQVPNFHLHQVSVHHHDG